MSITSHPQTKTNMAAKSCHQILRVFSEVYHKLRTPLASTTCQHIFFVDSTSWVTWVSSGDGVTDTHYKHSWYSYSLLMFLGNTDYVFARGKCQGGSTLPSLNAAAFFSDVAGAPHPERVLQGDQVSPAHQSSSGRPGWSQKLLHTAAQGSLCPTPDVCCTPDKTSTSAHLSDQVFSPAVLLFLSDVLTSLLTWVVRALSQLLTFCGSTIDEKAVEELIGWGYLPSPSLPVEQPAAQSVWHRTHLSTDALQEDGKRVCGFVKYLMAKITDSIRPINHVPLTYCQIHPL